MSATLSVPAFGRPRHHRRWVLRGGARRRFAVLLELLVAVGICLVGYYVGAAWFRVHEARWTVDLMRLLGEHRVSAALPQHILIFRSNGEILNGEVTTSCSSILTVVGLTALTVSVLRNRGLHALAGLLVALVAVIVVNVLRLVASVSAGLWFGTPAMVLFHDWVGTVWTLAATLGGFLLMVFITLPPAQRAEQNVAGRHTARRPDSWARPGLGYRIGDAAAGPGFRRRTLTGLVHRYLLPRRVSLRLAARRESGRIDYRLGHLPPDARAASVRALVADGLAAHTASLLAVATYDRDPDVLDALADAVAARQWEPVTNDRVAAVRLWARGWLLSRRSVAAGAPERAGADPDDPDDPQTVRLTRSRPPVPAASSPRTGAAGPPARTPPPLNFARPPRDALSHPPEDPR